MPNAKHLERSANNPNPDLLPVWSRITPFRFVYTKESDSQRGIFDAMDDTVPRKLCFGRLRRGLPYNGLGLRFDRVYARLARGLHSSVLFDDVFFLFSSFFIGFLSDTPVDQDRNPHFHLYATGISGYQLVLCLSFTLSITMTRND
ncbi:uncharacterized protein B0T23DRAFT_16296 [Neurospora hispaniola]|uniref:Uncharacterized protein n=1 Tax=Neurospora hispaniola TaxID=588809 RepID=A0AAJ0IFN1_9PEZI|nr:hypothetical protein B0T23DRAFT_16296 [Neurospora hispaniola]